MKRSWLLWLLVAAIALGVGLSPGEPANRAQAVENQDLFQAVDSWLKAAHVQPPDLPEAIIKVSTLPNGHYLVHMRMQLGEGWFEVWREGDRWQVKGAQPPR